MNYSSNMFTDSLRNSFRKPSRNFHKGFLQESLHIRKRIQEFDLKFRKEIFQTFFHEFIQNNLFWFLQEFRLVSFTYSSSGYFKNAFGKHRNSPWNLFRNLSMNSLWYFAINSIWIVQEFLQKYRKWLFQYFKDFFKHFGRIFF